MTTSLNYKNIQRQEGNWQIVVNPRPGSFEIEVWLLNIEGGKARIANVDKDGYLKLREIKDGEEASKDNIPFMRVPYPVWELIVNAITDTTPPLKKEILDAELTATKYHLGDMRRLVFEDKEPKITIDPNYSCAHGSCLPGKCKYREVKI